MISPEINILVHGLDDEEIVKIKVEEQMRLNHINFRMFTDPQEFIDNLHLKPHICFVDYVLPGPLNGIEITRIITSQNPDCKVIMVSGMPLQYSGRLIRDFFVDALGADWIEKTLEVNEWVGALMKSLQKIINYVKTRIEIQQEIEQIKEEALIRKQRKASRETSTNI